LKSHFLIDTKGAGVIFQPAFLEVTLI